MVWIIRRHIGQQTDARSNGATQGVGTGILVLVFLAGKRDVVADPEKAVDFVIDVRPDAIGLVPVALYHTLLATVVQRHIIGRAVGTSGNAYVMIGDRAL